MSVGEMIRDTMRWIDGHYGVYVVGLFAAAGILWMFGIIR